MTYDEQILAAIKEDNLQGFLKNQSQPYKGVLCLPNLAAEADSVKSLIYLNDKGYDLNQYDNNGRTPFYVAVRSGNINSINQLAEWKTKTVDTQKPSKTGVSPLECACRNVIPNAVEVLNTLVNIYGKSTFSVPMHGGDTPLFSAVKANRFENAETIIDYGVEINQVGSREGKKFFPLFVATINGNVQMFKLLLQQSSIKIDKGIHNGVTCLIKAAMEGTKGHLEIANLLLEAGADYTISSENGFGPEEHADFFGHPEIAQLIRDYHEKAEDKKLQAAQARLETHPVEFSPADKALIAEITAEKLLKAKQLKEIAKDPALEAFRVQFEHTFSSFMCAYKVYNTGLLQRASNTKYDKGAGLIRLAGELVPLPFIKVVGAAVAYKVKKHGDKKVKKDVSTVLKSLKAKSSDKDIKAASRELALSLEPQITQLSEDGAEKLAECAVHRMLEFMRADKVDKTQSLYSQIVTSLTVYEKNYKPKNVEAADLSENKFTDITLFQDARNQAEQAVNVVREKLNDCLSKLHTNNFTNTTDQRKLINKLLGDLSVKNLATVSDVLKTIDEALKTPTGSRRNSINETLTGLDETIRQTYVKGNTPPNTPLKEQPQRVAAYAS